ncbi:unnamed protein product [Prorocentrum cordatum]|uniref:Uncharacterized protein n=1 Tax=Prorocentrum cordatum TaxID=2364126 RepID=A0ABN9PEU0_9DINO|nr:unnamed protein product [Polarella glacialis]
MPGQTLMGIEETFDGWVRLADDAGWVFRGDCADGPALLPLGDLRAALAEPELSPAPGLQMFEVVGEEGVPVLREAAEDALALGRRSFGEFVLAEAQSYHGWLRLADGGGWAPCSTPQGARLLLRVRPDELQLAVPGTGSAWPDAAEDAAAAAAAAREAASRREALRQLEEAAVANSAVFFAALATARDHGVEKRDIARCHALRSSMGL